MKIDFDEKLRNINRKFTSNKTNLVEADKDLTENIASYAKPKK